MHYKAFSNILFSPVMIRMSLTKTLSKAIDKATYDPELEKQLAQEKSKARDARKKLRDTLNEYTNKNRTMVEKSELSLQGNTLASSVLQEANKWLEANSNATEAEVEDKNLEVLDKLNSIYDEDKNRTYFTNWLKNWDIIVTQWQTQNKLSEDKVKQIQERLAKEKVWFDKNSSESIAVYKERVDTDTQEFNTIIADPDLIKDAQDKLTTKKLSTQQLNSLQAQVDAQKKERENREKSQFNVSRITKKLTNGFLIAFLVALFVVFGLTGGSLAANDAVARPVGYRILYFIFGFIFCIPTILYFMVRSYLGYPPYFAAYLLPLYSYDPNVEDHPSFFESLVWFKENSVIREASERFSKAAEATKVLKTVI